MIFSSISRSCLAIVLLLALLIFCQSAVALMPHNRTIEAMVDTVEMEEGHLAYVDFRLLIAPDQPFVPIQLEGEALSIFKDYPPLKRGQILRLRWSLLTDAEGNQQAVYDVVDLIENTHGDQAKQTPRELTHQAYGEALFGKPIKEINDKVYRGIETIEGCSYASLVSYPEVEAMVVVGEIVRIDFVDFSLAIKNTPFLPLHENKMSYQAWKESHPEIEIWPHEYVDGYYLIWWSKDQDYGIVAEYTEGKITALRAGVSSHVTLVEGCS